jgi:hypothetical protein
MFRSFVIFTPHQIGPVSRFIKLSIMGLAIVWHACGAGYWWGQLNEREQLEDLGLEGRLILKWILNR